ncbi:hypothetical protein [Novosphingobium sp.]|uniref:hypothetical protein n=1 Tax=Novosphingobium sp. TaxID=1874826 RepID=UPI003BA9DF72
MIRTASFALAAALVAAGPALAQSAPAQTAASQAPSQPAPAPAAEKAELDPKAVALAQEILDIGMPPESRPAMFAGIMGSLRTQIRESMSKIAGTGDAEADAIIGRGIDRMYKQMTERMNTHLPDLYQAMARAYARQFSFEDLTQIRAFVGTPTGQRFFSRSATVMSDPDVMEANKRSMVDIMGLAPQMQKQMIDELVAHIAKKEGQKSRAGSHPS